MRSRRAPRSRVAFSCDARARPRSFPGPRRLDRAGCSHQYHCRQNSVRIAQVPVHSTTPQLVALRAPAICVSPNHHGHYIPFVSGWNAIRPSFRVCRTTQNTVMDIVRRNSDESWSLRRFLYGGSDWLIHRPIIRSAAGAVSGNWQSPAAPEASKNRTEVADFDPQEKFIFLTWVLESGPTIRTKRSSQRLADKTTDDAQQLD